MPIPLHRPTPPPVDPSAPLRPPALPNPFDLQVFAIDTERWRHEDALYRWGEWAGFVLLWSVRDHERGLVGRCKTCVTAWGDVAEAYGQAPVERCSDCLGTTFDGGYRAIIVRPSLWDFQVEREDANSRGAYMAATASIESTWDFTPRRNDWAIRADGTRWRIQSVSTQAYRTGYGQPNYDYSALGYVMGDATRESEQTAAYLPAQGLPEALRAAPSPAGVRRDPDYWPTLWGAQEHVRGPLLVDYTPDDLVPEAHR